MEASVGQCPAAQSQLDCMVLVCILRSIAVNIRIDVFLMAFEKGKRKSADPACERFGNL